MAELAPGEKSWMKMLKPGAGHCTFTALVKHLRITPSELHAHLRALDIHLTKFVREEESVRKTYRGKWRWLTEAEAARVIERHYALKGRRD